MPINKENHQLFRGLLQTRDGLITRGIQTGQETFSFQAGFTLSERLKEKVLHQPQHLLFSERSRIARLGVQIKCAPITADTLDGNTLTLALSASQVIPGYPGPEMLKTFFNPGLAIGRLVFCDPEALLTSDEVMEAIEKSDLKLPASTTVSSDGSIVISPHRVIYTLRDDLDEKTLGRILIRKDGRKILNRYQVRQKVRALKILPGQGVISTCSMYLNNHYVILQSGFELGGHLSATILDPVKTRGIRIYLEIVNNSGHLMVNPLISAKIFRAPSRSRADQWFFSSRGKTLLPLESLRKLEKKMDSAPNGTCNFIRRPVVAFSPTRPESLDRARIFFNGPDSDCPIKGAMCTSGRRNFSSKSACPHIYGTSRITGHLQRGQTALVVKYFPSMLEHRDIVNLACEGKLTELYFFEPSWEHGPFLSELDHGRLLEYHAFGMEVYWVSSLTGSLMVHTIRDGRGYFVDPKRFADFHKSMIFAFYGSNLALSEKGARAVGNLMDALTAFWGKNIGIVTGGGSGVMGLVNRLARERGILSGANFLDITDQAMTDEVDFCQVFQATCRHSRQKWFEIASFPIFNVGGLGSLEELGITLCNMKLSIMEPVPVILFDTEGSGDYWKSVIGQIRQMVRFQRAPAWIQDNIIATNDPVEVIEAYRSRLHLF